MNNIGMHAKEINNVTWMHCIAKSPGIALERLHKLNTIVA